MRRPAAHFPQAFPPRFVFTEGSGDEIIRLCAIVLCISRRMRRRESDKGQPDARHECGMSAESIGKRFCDGVRESTNSRIGGRTEQAAELHFELLQNRR